MADAAESIKKYRELLELDPGSRVFAMLAEELCGAGEWEEAAEVCRKGLTFHPDHLRAQTLLGWALLEMGEPDESERVLSKAVEEVRKNSSIFKRLSELAAISGKTESGAEYSRIYEAFAQTAGSGTPVIEAAPAKEASEWDDFKMEALDDLDAEPSEVNRKVPGGMIIGLGDILEKLARSFEGRVAARITSPEAILSDSDREMLKERIIALPGR